MKAKIEDIKKAAEKLKTNNLINFMGKRESELLVYYTILSCASNYGLYGTLFSFLCGDLGSEQWDFDTATSYEDLVKDGFLIEFVHAGKRACHPAQKLINKLNAYFDEN